MAKKSSGGSKAYFGLKLPWLVNVILSIFLGWFLGIFQRLVRGKLLLAILNIFLLPLFWILDIISMILFKDIKWLT
jgi:hypothetical protein